MVVVQVFIEPQGVRKPPIGFDDTLLVNFSRSWNNFQLFNITNFNNFVYII